METVGMEALVHVGEHPLGKRDCKLVADQLDHFDCKLVGNHQHNDMDRSRHKHVRDILTHRRPPMFERWPFIVPDRELVNSGKTEIFICGIAATLTTYG